MLKLIREAPTIVMSSLVSVLTVILLGILFWPLSWPAPGYLKALEDLSDARAAQEAAAIAATASEANRDTEDKRCRRVIAEAQAEWEADAQRRANFSDGFDEVLSDIEAAARDLRDANQSENQTNDAYTAPGACGPLVFIPADRVHGLEPASSADSRAGSP